MSDNQKEFIVLTSQRTGSKLLEKTLCSHPAVHCYGEILLGYGGLYQNKPPRILRSRRRLRTLWQAIASGALVDPRSTMGKVRNAKGKGASAIGFRVMYNQINRDPRVERYLLPRSEIDVIHLHRQNSLKQYVSLVLMHNMVKHGRTSAHSVQTAKKVNVEIDAKKAYQYCLDLEVKREYFNEMFSKHRIHKVTYEALTENNDSKNIAHALLLDFLEVDQRELSSDQMKMNPSALSDFVINYDQMLEEFVGTRLENLIAD